MTPLLLEEPLEREALVRLLSIKDSLIRISILEQGFSSIDRGIHIGGAMSSVVPLVALYYGGFLNIDIENPDKRQDRFVLSKGHAVSVLASIYADLGYFDKEILKGSRSRHSILNGHPGPLLPGVLVPTGPMGQGICTAEGFALAGRGDSGFDVFALTGDGELQEGTVWEAVMYSGAIGLDNFCVMVDRNRGQLDNPYDNVFPMKEPGDQFKAFGYRVMQVNGSEYKQIVSALREFKYGARDGRPTAIIINCRKGEGSFNAEFIKHKTTLISASVQKEIFLQQQRLAGRNNSFLDFLNKLTKNDSANERIEILCGKILEYARNMNIKVTERDGSFTEVSSCESKVRNVKVPARNKKINYPADAVTPPEQGKQYQASTIISAVMKAAAEDSRIVSIDSDLGSTSGLFDGVASTDRTRAINVGIAEANMMCIGEAYAVLGYNAWVSTFCPFFNWNVLRRIAINQQERREVIESQRGWLSEGCTLDLTFLATASNLDTQTNGATHMGNDDMLVFGETGELKIIDSSCPVQLLEIMKWILEGNKGLVYLRIMRSASGALYDNNYRFEFGKGFWLMKAERPRAVIVSSGRGVHEARAAGKILKAEGQDIDVIDMPSIDPDLLCGLAAGNTPVVFAEQNNGYIWNTAAKLFLERGISPKKGLLRSVNTLSSRSSRYIHSGTYGELLEQFSLKPEQLAGMIREILGQ